MYKARPPIAQRPNVYPDGAEDVEMLIMSEISKCQTAVKRDAVL